MKNVLLLMVDQMRFDAIAANGNALISTPNLDLMANGGCNFTRAYSTTPSCVPARATILTGLKAEHTGKVGYQDGSDWNYAKTLPQTFSKLGYQTECVGKMHVYPARKRMGYDHVELHDGYLHFDRNTTQAFQNQFENSDDYLYWLKEQKGIDADLIESGLDCNSWVARPWPYEERLHPTNWAVTKSIDFLRRRDTTQPFFLKTSFVRPHAPLDPPQYYFDMYMDALKNKKELYTLGNWEDEFSAGAVTSPTAIKGKLRDDELRRMIAAYYGCITHIDHQIGRLLMKLQEYHVLDDTIVLFVSDHGDQLGEHNFLRKGLPYEGSVHVPLLVYDPGNNMHITQHTCTELVDLSDLYPSLVDMATGQTVSEIDGKSFKSCLQEGQPLHDYLHGEHSYGDLSTQFILTKEWKYIWFSHTGVEQLFHLQNDPGERDNVVDNAEFAQVKNELRQHLVDELKNRPEGFVKNNVLVEVLDTPAIVNQTK